MNKGKKNLKDAYRILNVQRKSFKIDEDIRKNPDEVNKILQERNAYSIQIQDRAKKILILILRDIKKAFMSKPEILQDDVALQEYMKSICIKLEAYLKIRNNKARTEYAQHENEDIEKMAESDVTDILSTILSDNKNAFDINYMQPIPIDKMHDSTFSAKDKEIRSNFYEHILKYLKVIPEDSHINQVEETMTMQDVMEKVSLVLEQFWAYLKINTYDKRKEYMFELQKERKRGAFEKTLERVRGGTSKLVSCARLKCEPKSITDGKRKITIQKNGEFGYGISMKNIHLTEGEIYRYTVKKDNGKEYEVFSSDLEALIKQGGDKANLRILRDDHIQLCSEYFGGYIDLIPGEGECDTKKLENIFYCKKFGRKIPPVVVKREEKKNEKVASDEKGKTSEFDFLDR